MCVPLYPREWNSSDYGLYWLAFRHYNTQMKLPLSKKRVHFGSEAWRFTARKALLFQPLVQHSRWQSPMATGCPQEDGSVQVCLYLLPVRVLRKPIGHYHWGAKQPFHHDHFPKVPLGKSTTGVNFLLS